MTVGKTTRFKQQQEHLHSSVRYINTFSKPLHGLLATSSICQLGSLPTQRAVQNAFLRPCLGLCECVCTVLDHERRGSLPPCAAAFYHAGGSGPLKSPLPTKLLLSWEDIQADHLDVPAKTTPVWQIRKTAPVREIRRPASHNSFQSNMNMSGCAINTCVLAMTVLCRNRIQHFLRKHSQEEPVRYISRAIACCITCVFVELISSKPTVFPSQRHRRLHVRSSPGSHR